MPASPTFLARAVVARAADRFREYAGRCVLLAVADHEGPAYRPLCAPDLAYGPEELDVTDTGVLCPDCHGVLSALVPFAQIAPSVADYYHKGASA